MSDTETVVSSANYLIITDCDIRINDNSAYDYRGVEIGHRESTIEKFKELQKMFFDETGRKVIEMHVLTTETYGVCGKYITPSATHGYNVCCRIKFSDGTYGSGDFWVAHRKSTSKDGCAVYCAQHCIDFALKESAFRASLAGNEQEVCSKKVKKWSWTIGNFKLTLERVREN